VVADEVQDFGPAELRLLRALAPEGPNDVFLAGDVNQRIYKPRTAFARAGLEVRGRTSVLTLNYRTTEQIRRVVDRIVAGAPPDPGDDSKRHVTSSLVTGPEPELRTVPTVNGEIDAVARWLQVLVSNGYRPSEIAVLARTHHLVDDRVHPAVRRAGLTPQPLDDDQPPADKRVAIGTMHRGKGLQFRAVAVMGAEEGQVPLLGILDRQPDEAARQAFLELERNLLYVACSRARERLLVTGVRVASRFLPSRSGRE
jgi:superfamily I DNA/RNA helicase